jgi:hypothetical protein
MREQQTDKDKRVVSAPSDGPGVISVTLGEDEDVRWCWTHYPDGRSVVTGYEIIQKERAESEGEFSFEQAVEDLLWPGE